VKSDQFDQGSDVGLCAAQEQRPAAYAQAPRQHRQVEHQRGVGEHKLGQVDDYVRARSDRTHERLSPASLGGPVLVAAAAQNPRLFIEIDDARKPT
jgi:hypothetical protein